LTLALDPKNNEHENVLLAAAIDALEERGISNPKSFLEFADPDGILGACRWFDDQKGRVGTGLLVLELRGGGKPGYGTKPLPITLRLLNAVRSRCLSIDGCERDEIQDMFEDAASRRGVTVDELIDRAMHRPSWSVTPPHPAMIYSDGQQRRYNDMLGERLRPDATVVRADGESLLGWASRFWRTESEEEKRQ
jgi:hypothetical protein